MDETLRQLENLKGEIAAKLYNSQQRDSLYRVTMSHETRYYQGAYETINAVIIGLSGNFGHIAVPHY
jgi:hypothetical protein